MRHGQITDQEVAQLFNTTVANVRIAYVEYSKKKNPFYHHNWSPAAVIIQIMVSIVSVLLVFFTLNEMQVARDHAYLPDIYFEKTSFAITWDTNGLPSTNFIDDEIFKSFCGSTKYIDIIPKIELTNIGMGTAKNIHLEWSHSNNLKALTDYLYTINKEALFTYEINDSFSILISNGTTSQSTSRPQLDITYMKNDSEDYAISIPYEYVECIRHICYNYSDDGLYLPNIKIVLSYFDIQGKEYRIEKNIKIQLQVLLKNPNKSGYAFFEIIEV